MKISSQLEVFDHPDVRQAIRTDDEHISAALMSIITSPIQKDIALRLEGADAQVFLDLIHNVSDLRESLSL